LISVIVPTCNRNDLLSSCLDKLNPAIQRAGFGSYEVIVTDDSEENLAKKLIETKYNWTKWVEGPKKGPAANRNNGAKHAKEDWLVFLDDDCKPDFSLIENYVKGIKENPGHKVFEGAIRADREQIRFDEEAPVNAQGGYLFSCNFAIQKTYFNQLKGFDERFPFPAMEDTELAYRIRKDKNDLFFLEGALVIHPWRRKNSIVKMSLKRFDAALYFIEKYPCEENKFGFQYYFMAFLRQGFDTFKYAFKFRFRGLSKKILLDVMQLYFAFYMLFKNLPTSFLTK